MSTAVFAPWTPDQVESLNAYQDAGLMHPFTCPEHSALPLIATVDEWVCMDCEYRQHWAHAWMADGSWRNMLGLPEHLHDLLSTPKPSIED